jgi:hypothetical protein
LRAQFDQGEISLVFLVVLLDNAESRFGCREFMAARSVISLPMS